MLFSVCARGTFVWALAVFIVNSACLCRQASECVCACCVFWVNTARPAAGLLPRLCCEESLVPGMGSLITLIRAEAVGWHPKAVTGAGSAQHNSAQHSSAQVSSDSGHRTWKETQRASICLLTATHSGGDCCGSWWQFNQLMCFLSYFLWMKISFYSPAIPVPFCAFLYRRWQTSMQSVMSVTLENSTSNFLDLLLHKHWWLFF